MDAFTKRREIADKRRKMRNERLSRKHTKRKVEAEHIREKQAKLSQLTQKMASYQQSGGHGYEAQQDPNYLSLSQKIEAATNDLEEAKRKFEQHEELVGPPRPCDEVSEFEEEEEEPLPATIVPTLRPPNPERPFPGPNIFEPPHLRERGQRKGTVRREMEEEQSPSRSSRQRFVFVRRHHPRSSSPGVYVRITS